MKLGQKAHKTFQKKKSTKETTIRRSNDNKAVGRADGVIKNKIIELKPDNPRAIKAGLKQLQNYVNNDSQGRSGALWVYRVTKSGKFKFKCAFGC